MGDGGHMLHCALCGKEAEIITSEDVIIRKYVMGYKIICSNIGCFNATDWYVSPEKAISAWESINSSVTCK